MAEKFYEEQDIPTGGTEAGRKAGYKEPKEETGDERLKREASEAWEEEAYLKTRAKIRGTRRGTEAEKEAAGEAQKGRAKPRFFTRGGGIEYKEPSPKEEKESDADAEKKARLEVLKYKGDVSSGYEYAVQQYEKAKKAEKEAREQRTASPEGVKGFFDLSKAKTYPDEEKEVLRGQEADAARDAEYWERIMKSQESKYERDEAALARSQALEARTRADTASKNVDTTKKVLGMLSQSPKGKEAVKAMYLPSTGLIGPGSQELRRQGFQGKGYSDYAGMPRTRAGDALATPVRAGTALATPTPAGQALQLPSPQGRQLQFKQPQQMTWTPKQSVQGPNMGNLRNPGNVFGGMRLAQAQGIGAGLRQGLTTRLPSPMAMPNLTRPTTGLPGPMTGLQSRPTQQVGVTIGQPTKVESQLEPGEQIISDYQGNIKVWIGNRRGWEIRPGGTITQTQDGRYWFKVETSTGTIKPKSIGMDLNNAEEVAMKGKE